MLFCVVRTGAKGAAYNSVVGILEFPIHSNSTWVLLLGRILCVASVQYGCCLLLGQNAMSFSTYGLYFGPWLCTFRLKTSGYPLKKRLNQHMENRSMLGQPKAKAKYTIGNQFK